jgi:hypothetical protein
MTIRTIPLTVKYKEYYHVDIPYGIAKGSEEEMLKWLQEQTKVSGMVFWFSPISSSIHFDEEQDAVAFKLKFGV